MISIHRIFVYKQSFWDKSYSEATKFHLLAFTITKMFIRLLRGMIIKNLQNYKL